MSVYLTEHADVNKNKPYIFWHGAMYPKMGHFFLGNFYGYKDDILLVLSPRDSMIKGYMLISFKNRSGKFNFYRVMPLVWSSTGLNEVKYILEHMYILNASSVMILQN